MMEVKQMKNKEVKELKEESLLTYEAKNIQTLSPRDQIRLRPGMWIGKLGDGSQFDDGEYVLFKETVDNCIDEFLIGAGDKIEIMLKDNVMSIRDYGRGIPLEKLEECCSTINTSGKYASDSYRKSCGLNGVGIKAVNFLSSHFTSTSCRDSKARTITYEQGIKTSDKTSKTTELDGTFISYEVDQSIFGSYTYNLDFLKKRIQSYACLNPGLEIVFNGESFLSKDGMLDLAKMKPDSPDFLYQPIRLVGKDIECVIVHTSGDSEEYMSFVNGQYTSQGGTHQAAFREAVAKTLKDYYKKDYELSDMRGGLVGYVKVYVEGPEFESQTKIRLSSKYMSSTTQDMTIRQYILDFIEKELDDWLVAHPEGAKIIEEKAKANMRDRKAIASIKTRTRSELKKASLNNKKLRDCKVHLTDTRNPLKNDSMIFITEGQSASGSITAGRDVKTQAVFSLRGKPLNTFGMKKVEAYKNEEFCLLSAALDIEDGLDGLRYNKVILAADADSDGAHIFMLLLTYFVQFFPELIEQGHLYFFKTPLFRVRNKTKMIYCYSVKERDAAVKKIGKDAEIVRFKGLGEVGTDMKDLIKKENIQLIQIHFGENDSIRETLKFYMAANTKERFDFTMENLDIDI